MTNVQRLLELALKGLEADRAKIDARFDRLEKTIVGGKAPLGAAQ